ncbi:putative AP superfamily protein [Owenweeksia hongkongensis DSM 17368]|uniref:Putative AP superfamily protein n=1 Tax=Owenweeksia hongkongensis (strain DSM 17368 / CIP 108786 / JCM 12287 / NRRL B-23963 / UST20020801) TaxID=926562 RepID=G8R675_OWEHD|nr:alkaline phosphatase family protein [Owenweeksia hongkongensis]AEV33295.1 putative AP superfamily protein [Owenweeksia hongkongensis DSM 17368]
MKKRVQFFAALTLGVLMGTAGYAQKTFKERKVLFIGIDGVRSDALNAANTPNMDSLMNAGISTFDSWHLGITSSGPSWSSMLTGVWEPKHGVTNNSYGGADYGNYPYFPTRAKEVDPNLKAVQIITWNPMDDASNGTGGYVFNSSWDQAIDAGTYGQGLVTSAAKIQLQDPDLDILFIHYDECDAAGHGTGFDLNSPTYMNAIQTVDTEIGEVMKALMKRPTFADEDWLVLCTTDHGGNGYGHGGNSNTERHIWWFAAAESLPKMTVTGADPGSYQMPTNPVNPTLLETTPVLTDIAVTAIDWILPFDAPKNHTNWGLDGKSWIPDSLSIIDTNTVGFDERILATNVKFYPNPAQNELTIESTSTEQVQLLMLSLTGAAAVEMNINEGKTTIDVSNFAKGIYIIRLSSTEAVITQKVIIE